MYMSPLNMSGCEELHAIASVYYIYATSTYIMQLIFTKSITRDSARFHIFQSCAYLLL